MAAELPPLSGRPTRVYERGFFRAIHERTVDVNLEDNPSPVLCLVRSLDLAARLHFAIGPRLARFARRLFDRLTEDEFADAHARAHGRFGCSSCLFRSWRTAISDAVAGTVIAPPAILSQAAGENHSSGSDLVTTLNPTPSASPK